VDIIGNRNIISDASRTCQSATSTNNHAAGNSDTPSNRGVITNLTVVSNLHQIVDHHTITHSRILNTASIDRGVRTDLHIITNSQRSKLRDTDPLAFIFGVSKPVATQHRTPLDDATTTDLDPVIYRDVGIQARRLTN
tara:strand:+ start:923 stop:1336 length:414 start_codon:yes stop_codon:yes gene_type:complete